MRITIQEDQAHDPISSRRFLLQFKTFILCLFFLYFSLYPVSPSFTWATSISSACWVIQREQENNYILSFTLRTVGNRNISNISCICYQKPRIRIEHLQKCVYMDCFLVLSEKCAPKFVKIFFEHSVYRTNDIQSKSQILTNY